jgi:hypothetical protein
MIMPGSFSRLAPHSEIEIVRAGALIADMRLIEGSAAVDLASAAETEGISIEMGGARVRFMRSGLYRLDAPADGNPVVRVVRGKARIEYHGQTFDVGGKQQLAVAPSGGKLKAKKTGKREEDELDRWNAERRDLLVAESRKQNRKSENGRVPLELSPSHDCRACGVAPGRDPNSMPRTRPPVYPLVRFAGDSP